MKYILLFITIFSFGFAETILCYKNNVQDLATIEQQKFFGGECKGENSIHDMKLKGWNVADIKMQKLDNSINYIYVLKKDEVVDVEEVEAISSTELLEKILQDGKKSYQNKCEECHGKFGEIESSNTSRAINKLAMEELFLTVRGYSLGEYDRGMAFLMVPYADLVTEQELEDIYYYLQKINNK